MAASPAKDGLGLNLDGPKRASARVLPVALAGTIGELAAGPDGLVLRQPIAGRRGWLPLLVSWDAARNRKPARWRVVTVAEKSRACKPEVAFAARVWWSPADSLVIYRSLAAPASRCFLGYQTTRGRGSSSASSPRRGRSAPGSRSRTRRDLARPPGEPGDREQGGEQVEQDHRHREVAGVLVRLHVLHVAGGDHPAEQELRDDQDARQAAEDEQDRLLGSGHKRGHSRVGAAGLGNRPVRVDPISIDARRRAVIGRADLPPTPAGGYLASMDEARLRENLEAVRSRIAGAARRAGRPPEAVTLVAVSKKRPIETVRPLLNLGVVDLGENYPQELWLRAAALADLPVRWHLIGHLQGNKAKRTLPAGPADPRRSTR